MGPKGGNTSEFADEDAAKEGIYKLEQLQVTADMNAVADYGVKLPSSNGKLAVSGFCWGGGQSLRFATNRPDLKAAFVFYGSYEHTKEDIARIKAPVYGFYGGNDERIGATIPKTTEAMKEAGKTYDPVTYEGAGHGFMRSGEDPSGSAADKDARTKAWERWKDLLKKI
jgi:carboxymethylenebutenolidase